MACLNLSIAVHFKTQCSSQVSAVHSSTRSVSFTMQLQPLSVLLCSLFLWVVHCKMFQAQTSSRQRCKSMRNANKCHLFCCGEICCSCIKEEARHSWLSCTLLPWKAVCSHSYHFVRLGCQPCRIHRLFVSTDGGRWKHSSVERFYLVHLRYRGHPKH